VPDGSANPLPNRGGDGVVRARAAIVVEECEWVEEEEATF
jgi:hypothetical protein